MRLASLFLVMLCNGYYCIMLCNSYYSIYLFNNKYIACSYYDLIKVLVRFGLRCTNCSPCCLPGSSNMVAVLKVWHPQGSKGRAPECSHPDWIGGTYKTSIHNKIPGAYEWQGDSLVRRGRPRKVVHNWVVYVCDCGPWEEQQRFRWW